MLQRLHLPGLELTPAEFATHGPPSSRMTPGPLIRVALNRCPKGRVTDPRSGSWPRTRHRERFLFSDIESSTRLWEESPEEMAAALQIHDSLVREAIEDRVGYVFATGGDGFCAAFSAAPDAVAAAVEVQRKTAAQGDAIPFSVRIGLHTGQASR